MIDLNKIEFIGGKYGLPYINRDRLHYSFVGIKRNETTGKLQFWLPLGFDNFDNTDFELVKKFFFSMYKAYKQYISRRKYQLSQEEIDNQRDGIHEQEDGFTFRIEDRDEVVSYSKLNAIDKIMEGYDELKISSLAKKMITSSEIDYSKIYKYLHKAIYLEEDVAFRAQL